MKKLFYDDVCLVPRYSELASRSDADTSVEFLGKKFNLPIIPANMVDVINIPIAEMLSKEGYFYIMHRFYDTNKDVNKAFFLDFVWFANENKWKTISISIGVNFIDEWIINQIINRSLRVDFITIDVAHADHIKVRTMIDFIKMRLPQTKLIVGNVATDEACDRLIDWGADAIKVGIGGGRICTTRLQTGFHIPMFSCVQECSLVCGSRDIPLIADGGIVYPGDISKALVAGADMVMAGGIFAECIDSPAKITDDGHKEYRGSTSYELKGERKHIEGKKIQIKGSVCYMDRLEEIKQSLSSAISYAGGKDLSTFNFVDYVTV